MRILGLYVFSLTTLLCCASSQPAHQVGKDSCKLLSQEFSVDASTYKQFGETLSEFLKSENRLDVLFIKMKGGNHSASEMKRWLITNELDYKVESGHGETTTTSLALDAEKVLQLGDAIETGDFLQVCPYSTSNDSFLVLIKANSVIRFKYFSTETDYRALPLTDRNKIANFISLLTYLNSQE